MKHINNEYYHVFNRGVDRRNIFLEEADYRRFLAILTEFNSFGRSENTTFNIQHGHRDRISIKPLVEVIDYCLMPNHYHLILKQLESGGISEFMRKIGIGYTNYFNLKNDRSGVLFQGRTKFKHVGTDKYYQYLVEYVYLNPVDLVEPEWKKVGIKDYQKVLRFLEKYPWSSAKNLDWFIEIASR